MTCTSLLKVDPKTTFTSLKSQLNTGDCVQTGTQLNFIATDSSCNLIKRNLSILRYSIHQVFSSQLVFFIIYVRGDLVLENYEILNVHY